MEIKSGVRLTGLQPQIVLAAIIAEGVYRNYGADLVITSAVDSVHSRTSRHYLGLAIDIRTRDFLPNDIPKVEKELKRKLGDDFYVAFEVNHFHISFKPEHLTA